MRFQTTLAIQVVSVGAEDLLAFQPLPRERPERRRSCRSGWGRGRGEHRPGLLAPGEPLRVVPVKNSISTARSCRGIALGVNVWIQHGCLSGFRSQGSDSPGDGRGKKLPDASVAVSNGGAATASDRTQLPPFGWRPLPSL